MARVTVEDCIKRVPNRFDLVLGAAQRARELAAGAEQTIEAKDKNTVLALREIAIDNVNNSDLLEKVFSAKQPFSADESDDDQVDFDNVKVIGTEDIQFQNIAQEDAEGELEADENDDVVGASSELELDADTTED